MARLLLVVVARAALVALALTASVLLAAGPASGKFSAADLAKAEAEARASLVELSSLASVKPPKPTPPASSGAGATVVTGSATVVEPRDARIVMPVQPALHPSVRVVTAETRGVNGGRLIDPLPLVQPVILAPEKPPPPKPVEVPLPPPGKQPLRPEPAALTSLANSLHVLDKAEGVLDNLSNVASVRDFTPEPTDHLAQETEAGIKEIEVKDLGTPLPGDRLAVLEKPDSLKELVEGQNAEEERESAEEVRRRRLEREQGGPPPDYGKYYTGQGAIRYSARERLALDAVDKAARRGNGDEMDSERLLNEGRPGLPGGKDHEVSVDTAEEEREAAAAADVVRRPAARVGAAEEEGEEQREEEVRDMQRLMAREDVAEKKAAQREDALERVPEALRESMKRKLGQLPPEQELAKKYHALTEKQVQEDEDAMLGLPQNSTDVLDEMQQHNATAVLGAFPATVAVRGYPATEQEANRRWPRPNTPAEAVAQVFGAEGMLQAAGIKTEGLGGGGSGSGTAFDDGEGVDELVMARALKKISEVVADLVERVAALNSKGATLVHELSPEVQRENSPVEERVEQEGSTHKRLVREHEIAAQVRDELREMTSYMWTRLRLVEGRFFSEVKEVLSMVEAVMKEEFTRTRETSGYLERVLSGEIDNANVNVREERILRPIQAKQAIEAVLERAIQRAFNMAETITESITSRAKRILNKPEPPTKALSRDSIRKFIRESRDAQAAERLLGPEMRANKTKEITEAIVDETAERLQHGMSPEQADAEAREELKDDRIDVMTASFVELASRIDPREGWIAGGPLPGAETAGAAPESRQTAGRGGGGDGVMATAMARRAEQAQQREMERAEAGRDNEEQPEQGPEWNNGGGRGERRRWMAAGRERRRSSRRKTEPPVPSEAAAEEEAEAAVRRDDERSEEIEHVAPPSASDFSDDPQEAPPLGEQQGEREVPEPGVVERGM